MVHESSKCILSLSKKKKKITNRKQYELEKAKYNVVTKTFKQTLAIKREVR